VDGWFGRGSRLLVIARMMPRQSKIEPFTGSRVCDGDDAGGALLLAAAVSGESGAAFRGEGSVARQAFLERVLGSFACIFLLMPLFRPTSIPFYTLSTAQILANNQIRRRNIS